VHIEQGYLDLETPAPDTDVMICEPAAVGGRVRRAVAHDGSVICTHTVKRGIGLVREELERTITLEQFERVWRDPATFRLRKTRYRVKARDRLWEIDDFDDLDVVLAEVELPTADAEAAIPDWLAAHVVREVTDEPAFTSHAIACRLAGGG
jgi:CYTH domain-containing protein